MKRTLELISAAAGALICTFVPIFFSQSGGSEFPYPFLYFFEIALSGVAVLLFVLVRKRLSLSPRLNPLPWVAAGMLLAFVILGGFSIGPCLIPAFVAFLVTGMAVDLQTGGLRANHAAILLLATVIQAGFMLLAIQFT